MDTVELVEWFRAQLDCGAYYSHEEEKFRQAADTIERLQKELERTKAATMPIDQLLIERDAALAEVERLKKAVNEAYREAERDARDAYSEGRLDERNDGAFDQWGYPR